MFEFLKTNNMYINNAVCINNDTLGFVIVKNKQAMFAIIINNDKFFSILTQRKTSFAAKFLLINSSVVNVAP